MGVPSLPHAAERGMGEVIADSTFRLLCEWNCDENICCMVFDTTAANTGSV